MSALDWIRSKATARPVEVMMISEADAARENIKPGKWNVTRSIFKGRLPTKMVYQVKAEYSKLRREFEGDTQVSEFLKVGGQYRSEFNNCEFMKVVYEYAG